MDYSDGLEAERFILSILDNAQRLDADTYIGVEHFHTWPVRYHLSPRRANILKHLEFSGLDVLEIGAGMGAVSRYIAENCKSLKVIEGTQDRFNALCSRLRDLDNWTGEVMNFQDFQSTERFDVVCLIGVLEYADLYIDAEPYLSPQETMLAHAKRFLNPGGVLIVAIENRLGIKYFAGCTEDHTGQMFDGICGYAGGRSPRTFSRQELISLLAKTGCPQVDQYFPWPDYKISCSVISLEAITNYPWLASQLSAHDRFEDYTGARVRLFPETLALDSLTSSPEMLAELANSFLFLAANSSESPVRKRLLSKQTAGGQVAWHYTPRRRVPTTTTFYHGAIPGTLLVDKTARRDGEPVEQLDLVDAGVALNWRSIHGAHALQGDRLSMRLQRHLYFKEHDRFIDEFVTFVEWSFERWGVADHESAIDGRAVDATASNAIVGMDGPAPYMFIDQEWSLADPMSKTWFVFRNLIGLDAGLDAIFDSPLHSIHDLYRTICRRLKLVPALEEDIRLEVALQQLVSVHYPVVESTRMWSNRVKTSGLRSFARARERELAARIYAARHDPAKPALAKRLMRSARSRLRFLKGIGRLPRLIAARRLAPKQPDSDAIRAKGESPGSLMP